MEIMPQLVRAPELFGNFWLNSEPVSIRENLGNVILVDFWDYSCLACLRAIPYVQAWDRRYRDFGLVTVGVHTPKFRFGQDHKLVEDAIRRLAIEYPVVMDNEDMVWSAFGNRVWPSRFLIDKSGFIRFQQQGEGGYDQFERALQQLVVESGYRNDLPDLMPPLREEDTPGVMRYRPTGELFGGYIRSSLGNLEGTVPESTLQYVDPEYHVSDRFYAHGPWRSSREALCYRGTDEVGWLTLLYEAASLNAVFGSRTDQFVTVSVEQDGKPLTMENAGGDVIISSSGESLVHVGTPRLYNLVKNLEFGEHLARLKTSFDALELYSFSFTSSIIPEFLPQN
jgi:thiol-disulfide isomerase/thioredoxin